NRRLLTIGLSTNFAGLLLRFGLWALGLGGGFLFDLTFVIGLSIATLRWGKLLAGHDLFRSGHSLARRHSRRCANIIRSRTLRYGQVLGRLGLSGNIHARHRGAKVLH